MLFCRLLTVFKINFKKKAFRNTIRVSNGLYPDQDRRTVSPDLGPNYLQRSSGDDKIRGLQSNGLGKQRISIMTGESLFQNIPFWKKVLRVTPTMTVIGK